MERGGVPGAAAGFVTPAGYFRLSVRVVMLESGTVT
jgi:hypothetical protein